VISRWNVLGDFLFVLRGGAREREREREREKERKKEKRGDWAMMTSTIIL
jgi:hypothetical protein